jgi:chromate transporter
VAGAVSAPGRLRELALLFLRLGTIAFGGPAAHIALMEEEVVRRREWLRRDEFLDLVGAVNLLPGPNSTELAIHIGQRRAGTPGLLVAGVCFILPAMLLVLLCAWAYRRFGQVPMVSAVWHGVKPVVVAIVLVALAGFARSALRRPILVAVALAAAALAAARVHELLILLGAGGVTLLAAPGARPGRALAAVLVPWWLLAPDAPAPTVGAIFRFFLQVGAVLYGSGYVLLAFLRSGLVERHAWITEAQLLDAVAVGQVTPGPVFTTATFVGYLLAGIPGGLAATVGIFLPAFVLVGLGGRLLPWVARSPVARAFLDGVVAASLGLLALVTWQLARAAVDGPAAAAVAAISLALLAAGVNSSWLILAGAATGPLLR